MGEGAPPCAHLSSPIQGWEPALAPYLKELRRALPCEVTRPVPMVHWFHLPQSKEPCAPDLLLLRVSTMPG